MQTFYSTYSKILTNLEINERVKFSRKNRPIIGIIRSNNRKKQVKDKKDLETSAT